VFGLLSCCFQKDLKFLSDFFHDNDDTQISYCSHFVMTPQILFMLETD
jgi:hypothetical protein